jgi:pimeloyl-ACP methyl ester carboxylesterase
LRPADQCVSAHPHFPSSRPVAGYLDRVRATSLLWQRTGMGEPLVLLHGLGSTRDDFAALVPRLSQEYDVLTVDLPGHGQSAPLDVTPTVGALTDVLESDLDRLGFDRVHVLGNSLGGRVALELARRHRAKSVVAIAPSGMGLPPERVYQALAMAGARVTLRRMRDLIAPLSGSRAGRALLLAGLRARPARASSAEAQAVQGGFAESTGFWRMLWWSVVADVPTDLHDIDCPVVLAQGTRDLLSGGQTPRYLGLVAGSRFHPLFRAGHAPHSDTPDAIIRLIREATHAESQRPHVTPRTAQHDDGARA